MKQIILLFACLFALQGLAKADDDRAITVDQLPQKAQEFIQKYFPKNEISLAKMEKDFWEKKYEVVFVNPSLTEKEICDMYFSVQTRDDLLRISSLLSATADFSI